MFFSNCGPSREPYLKKKKMDKQILSYNHRRPEENVSVNKLSLHFFLLISIQLPRDLDSIVDKHSK